LALFIHPAPDYVAHCFFFVPLFLSQDGIHLLNSLLQLFARDRSASSDKHNSALFAQRRNQKANTENISKTLRIPSPPRISYDPNPEK
jgi:hypothetical protein